jgi:hypothetical protein
MGIAIKKENIMMADEKSAQMTALAGLKPRVDSANSRNPMQFAPTSSSSTKNAT